MTKFVTFVLFFLNIKTQEITRVFARSGKKAIQVRASDGAYCPITKALRVLSYYTVLLVLKLGRLIANQI